MALREKNINRQIPVTILKKKVFSVERAEKDLLFLPFIAQKFILQKKKDFG